MKKFSLEMVVGVFVIAGFMAFVYMSLQFGEFSVFSTEKNYELVRENNASAARTAIRTQRSVKHPT